MLLISVSIEKLLAALEEADAFRLPKLTLGAEYIFNNVYNRVSQNEEMYLSDIDFGSFELDDLYDIKEIHELLGDYEYKTRNLTSKLEKLAPIVVSTTFV